MNEEKLEQLLARQERHAKRQTLFTGIAAGCCVVILCLAVFLTGFVLSKAEELGTVMENLETITDELASADLEGMIAGLDGMVTNLNGVIAELDGMVADLEEPISNLGTLVENLDSFATSSEKAVHQAMDKLNTIDFDTLNSAIKNLSDVVEPLAKFFNVFK